MTSQPFPFTLSNLPGGNNPVADIDANFDVCMRGPSATVQGSVGYWDNTGGTSYAAGYPTVPAFGTIVKLVGVDSMDRLPAVDASLLSNIPAGLIFNYIAGMGLSNDSGTPNSILDISEGVCADSTNAQMISLGAFTKSTGGSWTAGTGNNGMGNGLTIAISTWYHVFAIINSNVPDVYFDTSVTAANKPVGTTLFRRIGSFKTDSSAHILAFVQDGSLFEWAASILDVSATNPPNTAVMRTLNVPPGVNVRAIVNVMNLQNSSVFQTYVSDPAVNDEAASTSAAPLASVYPGSGTTAGAVGPVMVRTNTSAQIRSRCSTTGGSDILRIATLGWIDNRGFV